MDEPRARALLGVGRDASIDDVRAAYRRLLRTHHPDVAGPSADSTRITAELNRAYALILHEPEPEAAPEPAPRSAARSAPGSVPTFDIADDADATVTLEGPPLDVFNRLCEAADSIGALSYVDRSNAILETIIHPEDGPTCSLMVTLEQRGADTLAYCTLESFEVRPGPPIEDVVRALTREVDRLAAS